MQLKKGEAKIVYSNGIAAIKWRDKIDMHVLTTYHKALEMTDTGKKSVRTKESIVKPKVILDYNI